ncbi:hypothetical protein K504DRAFT_462683 [Pleomassaria siparia CBS 279.74]|uniref:CHRD domain-containing protein n=1 Tax=Pleomassaria siparia CBS 279.74 TaxID=1314801 RepID=A0A6G1KP69_9PLEO|nr:hypothetical protein K504DRAFT_462683 [Pleomassaria siparia CBS 279.74]
MKITALAFSALSLLLTSAFATPVDLSSGKITLQLNIDLNQDSISTNAIGGEKDLFTFTSSHAVHATPDQVVNDTTPTGGIAGASGTFHFGINSATNSVCYNITLHNFAGEFSSPAVTATHIHEALVGASGPPRIAFPNPQVIGGITSTVRQSVGCVTGPFVTGVIVDGKDTGEGFHVHQIEADPKKFMSDTHSSVALAGAVRGQLA